MDIQAWTPEERISRLSHRHCRIIEEMITISEPATFSSVNRRDGSSLGLLDRLPVEILHMCFKQLDLQTLSRLACTSLLGKRAVEAFPAYRDLMKLVPDTLKALGQTGLAQVHSAATVHQALCSTDSVSCDNYGAFLFLPDCGRTCYECLLHVHDRWAMPISVARKCFRLPGHQLERLPVLHSIPGIYSRHLDSRQRRLRLVGVKQAREIALDFHEDIGWLDNADREEKKTLPRETGLFKLLRTECSHPSALQTPSVFHYRVRNPQEGMGSILFPSLLPGGELETAVWCLGCNWIYKQRYTSYSQLYWRKDIDLYAMKNRARSQSELISHVLDCPGAKKLAESFSLDDRTRDVGLQTLS